MAAESGDDFLLSIGGYRRPSFTPTTGLENDIYTCFHDMKAVSTEGFMILQDDTYDREYSFFGYFLKSPAEDPQERKRLFWDAINSAQGGNSACKVMVALDLSKSFDEQWPYKPGIWAPIALSANPVLPSELLGEKSASRGRGYDFAMKVWPHDFEEKPERMKLPDPGATVAPSAHLPKPL